MEILFLLGFLLLLGVLGVYFILNGVRIFWGLLRGPVEGEDPQVEEEEDVRYESAPKRVSRYASNWAQVARSQKELHDWTCQECGVYLGRASDRSLLHVHHRDLDPQNNRPYNLEVLCVICHSERPGVGHRRLAGAITRDGRRWRVEQIRS